MTTTRIALLVIAYATCLTGCAASYGDKRVGDGYCNIYVDEGKLARELDQASDCCSSMAIVPQTGVKFDGAAIYGLIKDSPSLTFPSGKSRFVAFAVDPRQRHTFLLIQPVVAGRTTLAASCREHKFAVFVGDGSERYRAIEPVITFLDTTGRVLAHAVSPVGHERGDFRVPLAPGATLAIVHTVPSRYGQEKRLFVKSETIAVVSPGVAGATTIRGPNSIYTLVTATGYFTLKYTD